MQILVFSAQTIEWIMKRELYGKMQKAKENSLNFVMKTIELIDGLKLSTWGKFDPILVCMLPEILDKIE